MKTKIFIFILLSLKLTMTFAQISPTPPPSGFATDNTNVQVSTATDVPHSEESISINKNRPLSLIISANTGVLSGEAYSQGFYFSLDGGTTWSGSDHLPNDGVGLCDPSTAFDAADQGYILTLNTAISVFGTNGIISQTTNNGGASWNAQVNIIGGSSTSDDGIDKEMSGTVDVLATSPYVNYFYAAWTNFDVDNNQTGVREVDFSRSTDGGSTFSTPINLKSGFGHGTNVQTGPNGEVYVCWADYTNISSNSDLLDGPGKEIAFAADLTNGGTSFSVSDVFSETGLRDLDANATFGGTRINDFPSMAVDKSCGPYSGRIYIVYTDGFDAGTNLVTVRSSDDHGTTWSSPQILNILLSTTSGPVNAQCWFPSIAVDDLTGLVNVVFYGLGNPTTFSTATFVAYSTDGGTTWQSLVVSDENHTTTAITCSDCTEGFATGYAGDYIGICSFGGHSYATWHDDRSGQWQVYVSRIDYNLPLLYSSQYNLSINTPSTLSGDATYQASNDITSTSDNSSITIASGATITYTAGNEIDLTPGFTADANSYFLAQIKPSTPCQTPGTPSFIHLPQQNDITIQNGLSTSNIYCYPNPTNNNITLRFNSGTLEKDVTLQIKDVNGRTLQSFPIPGQASGNYSYDYNTSALSAGVYFFTFQSSSEVLTNKFVKVN